MCVCVCVCMCADEGGESRQDRYVFGCEGWKGLEKKGCVCVWGGGYRVCRGGKAGVVCVCR